MRMARRILRAGHRHARPLRPISHWAALRESAKRQKTICCNPGLTRRRMINRPGSERAKNGFRLKVETGRGPESRLPGFILPDRIRRLGGILGPPRAEFSMWPEDSTGAGQARPPPSLRTA